jgi:hypothetical protein
MYAPECQFPWQGSNDMTHPLGLCVQLTMPQELSGILGCGIFLDIKMDQAIPCMTQATIVEVTIKGEECWPVQLMQQWDYLIVFHPLSAKVIANLPDRDTPASQQASLALGDVFVQDVHAGRDSWAYSTA